MRNIEGLIYYNDEMNEIICITSVDESEVGLEGDKGEFWGNIPDIKESIVKFNWEFIGYL